MIEAISTSHAHTAAAQIRHRAPHIKPIVGIILGSGLGEFVHQLKDAVFIHYNELPGFPKTSVKGHQGTLAIGYLSGVPVVCLQGRAHGYEGNQQECIKTYVRTLRLLGCDYFLATNASGSLREDMHPGELMLITDHINFQPGNPLIGPNDDEFGPRFLPLDHAYDRDIREKLLNIATHESIKLHQGVYLSVSGPNFETAAEIRAFRLWGADAVGMSTVPEVIIACHCGMKVAAIATITNFATGLNVDEHSHDSVLKTASDAVEKISRLIKQWVLSLS